MRHALIASLALMAAAARCGDRQRRLRTAAAAAGIPGCEKEKLGLLDSELDDAHGRRGQSRVPALVRRQREDQAVEGQRPLQRPGL